jgi:cytochrome c oxidase assembly factor CtaG
MLLLVVAIFSPLDAMSDALFSAHMTQHMLLIFAVAPLLVQADVPLALIWALPRPRAQQVARWWENQPHLRGMLGWLDQLIVVWVLFAGLLWIWHLPAFYEAALHETWTHELEHALFLASAVGFWWIVARRVQRRAYLPAIVALFAALLQGVALSALLIFTGRPLYDAYSATTGAWGLTPLEDQQLAGVIMGLPGHVLLLAVLIAVAYRWIDESSAAQGETTLPYRKAKHGL